MILSLMPASYINIFDSGAIVVFVARDGFYRHRRFEPVRLTLEVN